MIVGKPMIVPVIAFDVTYHWDGECEAFGQNAGSFVIGREQGASGSEKLAPLPLDRASYTVDRPGARDRDQAQPIIGPERPPDFCCGAASTPAGRTPLEKAQVRA